MRLIGLALGLGLLFAGALVVVLFTIQVFIPTDMDPGGRATFLSWAFIVAWFGSILLVVGRWARRRRGP